MKVKVLGKSFLFLRLIRKHGGRLKDVDKREVNQLKKTIKGIR